MRQMVINAHYQKAKIDPCIYGHFAEHLGRCIYEGLYVGEDSVIPNVNGMRTDVVEALKNIKIPVLRWPGGCFADEYHWKDGIGPKETRKRMINTHWGGVVEDNSFGTHEFFELCRQLDCEPYVNGNLGSGSIQEMQEWVEYMTFNGVSPMAELRKENGQEAPWRLKYFGVGNENWGCGGHMTSEHYADEYRRYQTYVRNYDQNRIYKIACGSSNRVDDYAWTETLLRKAGNYMDGLSIHHYAFNRERDMKTSRSALDFTTQGYYDLMKSALYMDELIEVRKGLMQWYDRDKRIKLIVDEWGTWHKVEPDTNPGFLFQQNTMQDALVAAVTLNIFNRHADRVHMANLAQTANVLQSVVLTEGDKLVLTPSYHVFDLFKNHQNATLIDSFVESEMIGSDDENQIPDLNVSASLDENGRITITLVNLSHVDSREIDTAVLGHDVVALKADILTGGAVAHNTFESPDQVKIKSFLGISVKDGGFTCTIPPLSVLRILL